MTQLDQRISMLVVEDQALMRQTLREYLQSAYPDALVLEAADGESALKAICASRVDLVLMDVHLPDANGIIVAAQIKKMRPATMVIVVSQHAGTAYFDRARAAGAFAYITKDKVYRELLPTVSRALGRAASTADIGIQHD
jgi:DNA-binding NarL/FixJ family response regulator